VSSTTTNAKRGDLLLPKIFGSFKITL